MTKQVVSDWFGKLPVAERSLPLLLLDGIVYTPQAAYDEVMRDSPVGQKLQQLIESGRFGTTTEDEQSIAKTRLEQIYSARPPDAPYVATLSGKTFTASQMIDELQSDSAISHQWVNNEIQHMNALVRIR